MSITTSEYLASSSIPPFKETCLNSFQQFLTLYDFKINYHLIPPPREILVGIVSVLFQDDQIRPLPL